MFNLCINMVKSGFLLRIPNTLSCALIVTFTEQVSYFLIVSLYMVPIFREYVGGIGLICITMVMAMQTMTHIH
jgi:hypothetical protein